MNKKLVFTFLSLLAIVGYGALVFASAPSGGYTPGQTLNPDCAPNDVDCIVALPSGSSVTADNGLTATGGNVQLGGLLTQSTNIDLSTYNLGINTPSPDHQFQVTGSFKNEFTDGTGVISVLENGDNILGASIPGFLSSVFDPSANLSAFNFNTRTTDSGGTFLNMMGVWDPSTFSGFFGVENSTDITGFSKIYLGSGSSDSSGRISISRDVTSGSSSTNIQNVNFVSGLSSNIRNDADTGIKFDFGSNPGQFYSFPRVDGTAGQVLATDGAGLLSWTTPSGGGGSSPVVIGGAMNDTLYTPSLGAGAGGYYPGPDVGGNIIFGLNAGNGANNAVLSTFLGYHAGENATNASFLNAIGLQAGQNATNAAQSNFFGVNAGKGASQVIRSTFLGDNTGINATNASDSFFVGQYAGGFAANASNSIFIGDQAGNNDTVNNTANPNDFSILLGSRTSTGGYSNSIALGQRATNTASNQFMIGSSTRPISETVWILDNMGATATLNTSGVITTSDERLKNITGDLSNDTLDKLINLKTVNFTWKSDNSLNPTPNIGFIAQNVHEYFPELTYESSTGYLGVNYAGMTPILVEAIREMNLKITTINDMNTPNTWRDSLIAWFGNAMNGITDLYVKVFHADRAEVGELCVKKSDGTNICVNGDQLQTLLQPGTVPQAPLIPSTPPDNQTPLADPTTNDDQPGDSLDNTIDDQSTSDTDSDTNSSDTTGDSSGTVSQ